MTIDGGAELVRPVETEAAGETLGAQELGGKQLSGRQQRIDGRGHLDSRAAALGWLEQAPTHSSSRPNLHYDRCLRQRTWDRVLPGAQLEYGPEAPRQRRGQDHPRPLKLDCYSWQPPQPHHSPRSKLLTGHWAGEKLCLEGPAVRARQRRSLFSVSSPLARVPHLRLTLATAQPSATQPTRGNTHEAFIVTTTQASRLLSPAVSRDQPSTSKTRIRVRALVARPSVAIMVCAKCQKLSKGTTLATPEVKKKSEMYYGSPASSSKAAGANKSTTLAQSGIGKAGDRDQRQTCLFANTSPEQALVQVGQKSIRPVLELVFEMQNQNHSGTHFLPYLRIQKRWYGGSCIFVASSLR
ncbi:hypothetical protein Purlil1_3045 [Purpureocillium lilacinum]|uniref:Uncharacterized protein n=1 Tax=Purpureocillium lilacinum TaxID=33203 RepID=A0ABR0C8B8_PURLI|nr:hypothetical protein Purlil1_3045 [Purpureocillium lilacinum]